MPAPPHSIASASSAPASSAVLSPWRCANITEGMHITVWDRRNRCAGTRLAAPRMKFSPDELAPAIDNADLDLHRTADQHHARSCCRKSRATRRAIALVTDACSTKLRIRKMPHNSSRMTRSLARRPAWPAKICLGGQPDGWQGTTSRQSQRRRCRPLSRASPTHGS